MLTTFERAMANLSIMLVKARAPSDQLDVREIGKATRHHPRTGAPRPAPAPRVGRSPTSPARRFHGFTDLRADTPFLARTWRQLGDWFSGTNEN